LAVARPIPNREYGGVAAGVYLTLNDPIKGFGALADARLIAVDPKTPTGWTRTPVPFAFAEEYNRRGSSISGKTPLRCNPFSCCGSNHDFF
jgi:hypothetical protein